MSPSDNSTGLMHRTFPADFIETSSQGRPRCRSGRGMPPAHHEWREIGPSSTPRRVPRDAIATRPAPEGATAAPAGARDACAIPVAGQRYSRHQHAGRHRVPGDGLSAAPAAGRRPPRLGARAGERLAKIVVGSRGIGSCTAPRQWVAVIEDSETDSSQERRRWCSADKDNPKKYPAELKD